MFEFLKAIPAYLARIFASVPDISIRQLNELAVMIGKAFGPPDIRHFSELTKAEQDALLNRVAVLRTKHVDWPPPFNWIPRTVTTWVGPFPPIIWGNTTDSKPIPERGKHFATRGYIAMTTEEGVHMRFGFRPDDVDNYITFPSFTIKKV